MRIRFVPYVALVCLAALPSVARPDDTKKDTEAPAVVIRVRSLDGVLGDFKYLAGMLGQEEPVKQFEAMIRKRTGKKGLDGFDTKKPIGLYGTPGPNGLDSTIVLMLPVKDEKAVLDLVENLGATVEKDDDGVYTITHEKTRDVPVYYRIAHHYAYVTFRDKENIAKSKLLPPAAVLPPGHTGLISATVRIDLLPDEVKEKAISEFNLRLADQRDQRFEGKGKTQKELGAQAEKELRAQVKSFFNDGRELTIKINLDRKASDLSVELSLDGKPGSKLATAIADLGKTSSLFAGMVGKDSAASVLLSYTLPERVRKALTPVIDEGISKVVDKVPDETLRAVTEKLLKVLAPSLKAGEIDAAIDLRGPSAKKHYTLVAGVKLKNGKEVEKTIKEVVKDLPAQIRDAIKLDAEKAGAVNIHGVEIDRFLDDSARELFGNEPIYFAVRSNALYLAAGEDSLKAIKEALAAKPGTARMIQIDLSMARLAQLMARDNPDAPKAAEKAFAKGEEGDRVHIVLEGGSAFKARISIKPAVLKFFHELEEAKKSDDDK
jgi:hypothetical protein